MAIEFGPCDDEGYRDIHLVSELIPSTPEDMIQWIVDGVPFGPVQKPGLYVGRVLGDGEFHQIELHIVAPEDATGDAERIEFPACDKAEVSARISSVDFGECDSDGNRPIRVTSRVAAPDDQSVSLQWLVDGEPLGEAVGPGAHVGTIVGDGKAHTIEVRVISPDGGTGDTREVTIPECDKPVEAHIRSIDFGDCDPEGYRPVRLVPQLVPADATDVIVQWFIDGEPFGPEGPPTAVTGRLKGDGNRHDVELRVIAPDGAKGDTEAVEIPVCERVQARIRSVDFADCDDDGNRPVRLISAVIPGDTQDVTVQWVIDGELFGEPGPIGTFTGKVKGDGKTHQIELRVVQPGDDVELPAARVLRRLLIVGARADVRRARQPGRAHRSSLPDPSPEPVRPPVPAHDLGQHHGRAGGERHHTLTLDHRCRRLVLHARIRTHEQPRA